MVGEVNSGPQTAAFDLSTRSCVENRNVTVQRRAEGACDPGIVGRAAVSGES
jgi:hypothetical protein